MLSVLRGTRLPIRRLRDLCGILQLDDETIGTQPTWSTACDLDFALARVVDREVRGKDFVVSQISKPRLHYLAIHCFEVYINGDGASHFFHYDIHLAHAALEACAALGLAKSADLLRKARTLFPHDKFPETIEEVEELLFGPEEEAYFRHFDEVDDEFFAIESTEPYLRRRLELAAKHSKEFFAGWLF
jgi:hypothetical protein